MRFGDGLEAVCLLNEQQRDSPVCSWPGSLYRTLSFDKSNSFDHEGDLNGGVSRRLFTFLLYVSGSYIKLSAALIKFEDDQERKCGTYFNLLIRS